MARLLGELLIVGGALFVLLAGVGVLRLRDVYARMHAATKAPTLGLALIVLGGSLVVAEGRPQALLALAFVFVTAPCAAHLVGRIAYRAEGVDLDLAERDDLAELMDDDEAPDPGR
ncbi:MAG TPA: monovalent cation/H(+) antiporter subunit G [Acidimicrobiales bacterium]|mgnify:CR=1 FL=1|nr:monovalent cation/H(+) antiporter subunit G [Acidimicrobiales bacterium]